MEPAKLFVAPLFREDKSFIRLLRAPEDTQAGGKELLYKKPPKGYRLSGIEVVSTIQKADFVIIPQAIRVRDAAIDTYIDTVKKMAQEHRKPALAWIGSDLAHRVHVKNMLALKGSAYKHQQLESERIVAPFVEDLGEEYGFDTFPKTTDQPIVSFCGYAGFPNLRTRVRFYVKNFLIDVASFVLFKPILRVYKRGIYFRRVAMSTLKKDNRVKTNFIARDFYSANTKSHSHNPKEIRNEYVHNMKQSHFVLAPKGDANFSNRFYEALSLGRVPVLIDTDMQLPFEDRIKYDEFIVRVPYNEIHRVGEYVREFYDRHSSAEFAEVQWKARETFEKFLRFDSFMNIFMPELAAQARSNKLSRYGIH